ncbi:MAG: molybdopterin converting factor subunit 1 [Hyphomicrobiaceae bacterium]
MTDAAAKSTAPALEILYFAWVREKIGRPGETVSPPREVATIADLVRWLAARGPEYAEAFARPEVVRAAIDKTHVKASAPLAGAREVAFFPPVTGG